jgi:aminopeptidase N
MDVEITCEENTETYRIIADKPSQEFNFGLPSQPLMVIVDKGDWVLKTLEFDKPSEELLYQLRHGDTMSRVRAARALAKSRHDDRVDVALGDVLANGGFWGLRREAALALGEVRSDEAQRVLLEGLSAEDARVRLAVVEALGDFDKSKGLDATLIDVFRNDFGYRVRAAAVTSLVKMESKQANKICLEALKIESNRELIRNAGLSGLVDLKATDDIDKVKALAKPGNRRTYRHEAITSYAKLAKKLDSERQREEAADFLSGMLDDWYLRTRRTVISALGVLGEKRAVDNLRDVARNDPIESLRARASKTANAIEAKQKVVAETKDLQDEIEALSARLESLKAELRSLEAKVPTPADSSERVSKVDDE